MRSGFRTAVVAVVTVVGGLLAACTTASDTGADSTMDPQDVVTLPSSTVDAPDPSIGAWCALVPASLVASTLGIELREPTESFTTEEIRCTFVPVSEGELTIAVRFRVDQTAGTFAAYRASLERPDEPTSDLPGVGDEAFYRTNEFDIQVTQILVARQGAVAVELQAPGALEACANLVRAILAQLA